MAKTICILGGGASGLYCAVQLKKQAPAAKITVLERNARVGKKLLGTGNGKCNFTNLKQDIAFYESEQRDCVRQVLNRHKPTEIIQAFAELGIESTQTGSLVYPRSLQASSVLDALRLKAEAQGITLQTDYVVKAIQASHGGFTVLGDGHTPLRADIVIVAGGSSAGGGSSSGLKLLRTFGHSAAMQYPALVPVVCDTRHTLVAKGMRAQAEVRLYKNDRCVAAEKGEVLFTDYGVSGIAVMQLSRYISKSLSAGEKVKFTFSMDFACEYTEDALLQQFTRRHESVGFLHIGDFFNGFLNKKVGQAVLKACGISDWTSPVSTLSDDAIRKIAKTTKQLVLNVTGVKDMAQAQAAGGGIRLDELYTDSLESKLQKNLYACGEVLDVLGACGGYNLTWAWASAYTVARAIANKI